MIIGITSLSFCKFKKTLLKNQKETPYSAEGRTLICEKTKKRSLLERISELYSEKSLKFTAFYNANTVYNLEYFLNRAYAYNRDRGKCKICCDMIDPMDLHCHHIDNTLPKSQINKVFNLASTHHSCHIHTHDNLDISHLDSQIQKRILGFRNKLGKNLSNST